MAVKEGFKQKEVGVIPEGWDSLPTTKILQKNTAGIKIGPFGSQLKKEYLSEYGRFKVYGQENIYDKDFNKGERYIDKEKYKELKTCELMPGDIVISMMGTVGHCVIVPDNIQPGIMDSHLIRIRVDSNIVSPLYIRYSIAESESIQLQIKNLSVGGIMAGLNSSVIRQLVFVLPPLPEQEAIATALSDMDGLINSLSKLIDKKKNIKQGAMQELLTGKKRLEGFSGEWEDRELRKHLKLQVGFPFSSKYFNQKNVGLRLIKNRDLKSNDLVFYYNGEYNQEYVVSDGDVLIGMDGDFIVTVWNKGRALLNQRVGRLIILDGLDLKYMSYALIKPLEFIHNSAFATTVKHLYHNDIEKLVLNVPPTIEEQKAIATILSDMDKEIEKLQAKLDKYKAIKQGMMQELLTGRIRILEGA